MTFQLAGCVHYHESMKKKLWNTLAVLLLLVVLLGAGLYGLTRTPPEWYRPPDPTDPQVAELADRVEFRLLEEFQKIREDPEPWRLRVREKHINIWLASRLRDWIDHQGNLHWPENFDMPQVRFEPDGISLAISIDGIGPAKVVVTRLRPRFEAEELYISIDQFSVGRLDLPGEPLLHITKLVNQFADDVTGADPLAQLLFRMLRGEERIDPVLDLADSRRVRLTDLQLDDGSIVITARTLSRDDT